MRWVVCCLLSIEGFLKVPHDFRCVFSVSKKPKGPPSVSSPFNIPQLPLAALSRKTSPKVHGRTDETSVGKLRGRRFKLQPLGESLLPRAREDRHSGETGNREFLLSWSYHIVMILDHFWPKIWKLQIAWQWLDLVQLENLQASTSFFTSSSDQESRD